MKCAQTPLRIDIQ